MMKKKFEIVEPSHFNSNKDQIPYTINVALEAEPGVYYGQVFATSAEGLGWVGKLFKTKEEAQKNRIASSMSDCSWGIQEFKFEEI